SDLVVALRMLAELARRLLGDRVVGLVAAVVAPDAPRQGQAQRHPAHVPEGFPAEEPVEHWRSPSPERTGARAGRFRAMTRNAFPPARRRAKARPWPLASSIPGWAASPSTESWCGGFRTPTAS